MHALVFVDVNQLEYREVVDPVIKQPTDAIIRVSHCGICGSDLHVIEGRETGIDSGTTIGHEFVGEVVARGDAVKRFQVGDKVCSPFTTNCGDCTFCKIGMTARCQSGALFGWVAEGQGLQGTHAQYLRVPLADGTLLKMPSHLSPAEGILLGDNLVTGYYCAQQGGVGPGKSVVVLGCGTVGVMAIAAARLFEAEQIIAVDAIDSRRATAERMGATASCSVTEAADRVADLTNGLGADVVLEAVGSVAVRLAFELVRPGGVISSVGVATADTLPISPVEAYDKNLTFHSGRCPARSYMSEVADLLASKTVDVSQIVTHEHPLAEAPALYQQFAARAPGMGKVILEVG